MRFKIVTLWGADNYGAFLQAYALGHYLSQKYDKCVVTYSEESAEKHGVITYVSRDIKKCLYQLKLGRKFEIARKQFNIESVKCPSDIAIIGADEVWNVNNNFFNHLGIYIGRGINTTCCITYAPSANGANPEEFEAVYGDNPFETLKSISVRDKATEKLVYDITGFNPPIVLDPTFLIDDYQEFTKELDYKNYLFVYGYSFTNEEIDVIKKEAQENNLTIISAGAYQKWTDIQVPASPSEFLGLIKNADFVVTSTFHGSVFSILFNKQFISFARQNTKIVELLDSFDLSDRNASSKNISETELNKHIDYCVVNQIIQKRRQESIKYLEEGIK